jgi:hypothetical protein
MQSSRTFKTLAVLIAVVAGLALIYTGWQSKPGREFALALGLFLVLGALLRFAIWFWDLW